MPILDFSAIRIAIVREAQRITGVTCMVAQPETPTAPRPPKPYLSLKFNQVGEKQGNDAANCVSGALWNVGGQRGLTVDFNSYGRTHEEAYELMLTLQAHLEGEAAQANLRAAGIAIWRDGSIADLSELMQTGYEGRARLEVQFGFAVNFTEDRGLIEQVTVNGEVTTDQGRVEETTAVI